MGTAARSIVDRHEAALTDDERRRRGAHYTPTAVAGRLVALALDAALESFGRLPRLVCDPSCGAGAILLAAADALVAHGVDPAEALEHRLVGVEVDPGAAAAARAALVRWAGEHGVADPPRPVVVVADATAGHAALPGPPEVVVGNPPFLSPLDADAAVELDRGGRPGKSVLGAYTDAAVEHLALAVERAEPGAVVCLLQPQSTLAARDAAAVRAEVTGRADLVGLWVPEDRPFDAQVEVCAPILRVRAPGGPAATRSRVWLGDRPGLEVPNPGVAAVSAPGADPGDWAGLLAVALGVPPVPAPGSGPVLRDVARVTAGFRDEFYALAAVAVDDPAGDGPCLVTSGMIDPGRLEWGSTPRRLAGRSVTCPRADLARLARDHPRVSTWAAARAVPKVLVASQTRMVEAAVDPAGECLPVTPVISVEPMAGGPDPWWLAAAVSAPVVSARLAARSAGTGRNRRVIRMSAATLGATELPCDEPSWRIAAAAWREHSERCSRGEAIDTEAWAVLGRTLDVAHGVHHAPGPPDDLLGWWLAGLPGVGARNRRV